MTRSIEQWRREASTRSARSRERRQLEVERVPWLVVAAGVALVVAVALAAAVAAGLLP